MNYPDLKRSELPASTTTASSTICVSEVLHNVHRRKVRAIPSLPSFYYYCYMYLIQALAEYEKMSDEVVATEDMLREWIFEKKNGRDGIARTLRLWTSCKTLETNIVDKAVVVEAGSSDLYRSG